jgi:hypothetical protein
METLLSLFHEISAWYQLVQNAVGHVIGFCSKRFVLVDLQFDVRASEKRAVKSQ